MTPEQREIARHMLGLPNKRRRSCRNRYCSGYTPDLLKMQTEGWLVRFSKHRFRTVEDLWILTEIGARLALNKGEKLDPEDFPRERKTNTKA